MIAAPYQATRRRSEVAAWFGARFGARFGDSRYAGKQATVGAAGAASAINLGADIVAPKLMPLPSATRSGAFIHDEFRTQQELLWQAVVAMLHALVRRKQGDRLAALAIACKHLRVENAERALVACERRRRALRHDLIWQRIAALHGLVKHVEVIDAFVEVRRR